MHDPSNTWLSSLSSTEAVRLMADLLPEAAVFTVDADRVIQTWSSGAERLLGLRADEVVGHHCLKANRCVRCIQGCGIAEHGQVRGVPLGLFRADGVEVRVRKSGRAFFDEQGAFLGGIEVLVPAPPEDGEAEVLPLVGRTFHGLVTRDPGLIQVFDTIRNVAETDATVLVRGESGTGKELVARAIHAESTRREGPFVAVNCAALTPSLIESELFGHVRGAFTGAVADRRGVFLQAQGGTLFLDEVAELPLDVQAKLLRVLQERVVVPVGDTREHKIDVRIVAATHRALREEVKSGKFREDLLYRLRVVPIFLPPLRDRRADIDLLLRHFVLEHNRRGPRVVRDISPDVMRVLLHHAWPGNVRELYNVVEYAFAVGRAPELTLVDLPPELRELPPGAASIGDLPTIRLGAPPSARGLPTERSPGRPHAAPPTPLGPLPDDEADAIREALRRTAGNVQEAAELLGMSRPTFWRKRKRLGL
jgi:transcriptional regulator with PAS, ATPase and Fis domain